VADGPPGVFGRDPARFPPGKSPADTDLPEVEDARKRLAGMKLAGSASRTKATYYALTVDHLAWRNRLQFLPIYPGLVMI